MSRFFTDKFASLTPYTPGEQPRDMQYVKLNTNESPFPPSAGVAAAVAEQCGKLQLYSDPETTALRGKLSEIYGVSPRQILVTNGSDEVLNFAFMAFCDESHPAVFPDITYGFYKVFAGLNGVPYREVPLEPDFSIEVADYFFAKGTIFIANPNAPTGLCLSLRQIEGLLRTNPDNVVVIDEAYIDFGGESAIPLTKKYDNLLVVQTFSKSRSMAGARLGFAVGSPELIRDLNTIKYSVNPYNVNRMTMAAGLGALEDDDYFRANCRTIMENRAWTTEELNKLGFETLPSMTNFVFTKNPAVSGEELYLKLKARGILVRHFTAPRIRDFNRITIGTREQMEVLINTLKEVLL